MGNDLENSVNHRLATVASLLKRQIFRLISTSDIEITPEQWVILNYLWETDGLTIKELVERSKKDFANVTRIVEKLEKLNYVKRIKNENDGRSFLIFLTKKSLEIKPLIENCWKQSMEISLKGINISEQKKFLDILTRIEDNIMGFLKN